jgi:hypothetical protein
LILAYAFDIRATSNPRALRTRVCGFPYKNYALAFPVAPIHRTRNIQDHHIREIEPAFLRAHFLQDYATVVARMPATSVLISQLCIAGISMGQQYFTDGGPFHGLRFRSLSHSSLTDSVL